ncbi:MAG: aminoglycoside phosphotransferase family protein, partial [Gemmobacter sp.]|nr:aminoglycoside phosphotransferase family protein [Gemmobacter sp.]
MTQHAPPPDLLPPPVLARLRAMLPDLAAEPAVPLRGGRCNRLWRIGSVVAKLYASGSARPLFPNDPLAEAAALQALAGTGLAPGLLL